MSHFGKDLQEHPAIILSLSGWVSGKLHLPSLMDACTALSQTELLKLTDFLLEDSNSTGSFYGLRIACVDLILPDAEKSSFRLPQSAPDSQCLKIHLHLKRATVRGQLEVPPSCRLTDVLQDPRCWFVMRECTIKSRFEPDPHPQNADVWPLVLINSRAVVGFSDDKVL